LPPFFILLWGVFLWQGERVLLSSSAFGASSSFVPTVYQATGPFRDSPEDRYKGSQFPYCCGLRLWRQIGPQPCRRCPRMIESSRILPDHDYSL
jgi:hypothetical protein